jgi:hypothetical protein
VSRIALLTSNTNVQQAVAELVPYLQEPRSFVEQLVELRALAPTLVLWHPSALHDQTAAEIVTICPNIIVITPPIPVGHRRFGGLGYTKPMVHSVSKLASRNLFAVMPFSPEDMARIIRHRLKVSRNHAADSPESGRF